MSPLDVAIRLAPAGFLDDIGSRLSDAGVVRAVQHRQIAPIFEWAMQLVSLQGIADRAAISFQQTHGLITWDDVQSGLQHPSRCQRLRSWWHFRCGYRKTAQTCAEPSLIAGCRLPALDLRKGALNEAAFGFALFVRDICGGDFVGWIDERLMSARSQARSPSDDQVVIDAVLHPLIEIPGTGPKIWSMVLADLLLGADPMRKHWIAAGAAMIVIDTLTHNFLLRAGILAQNGAEHAYGPRCYLSGGCADLIRRIAEDVDARAFDCKLPAFCPRFIQHALWYFCAEGGWNICNGRQIDDRYPCRQAYCPAGAGCARLPLKTV